MYFFVHVHPSTSIIIALKIKFHIIKPYRLPIDYAQCSHLSSLCKAKKNVSSYDCAGLTLDGIMLWLGYVVCSYLHQIIALSSRRRSGKIGYLKLVLRCALLCNLR